MRGSEFPADMHNTIRCPLYIPSFMKIESVVSEQLRWQGHLWVFFLCSKGHNSHKNEGIKISCRYAKPHMISYLHTKFHDNWINSFRGVAMTRFWDGRTDGQTDGVTALLDLLSPSATQVKNVRRFFKLISKEICM